MRIIFFLFFICTNCFAQLPSGEWHAALKINDTLELPFKFITEKNIITIINGEEKIIVDEINFSADSIFIKMPVFDSEFRCKLTGSNLTGNFINHARKSQNIFDFRAVANSKFRFSDRPEKAVHNISGRYHVIFDGEEEDSKNSVAIFNQDENYLTATFLTTTGDYRFLEGEVNGNRIWLSAFDGSHLFLFTAIIKNDSLINGEFFSGQHWHDTWSGKKDSLAELSNPDSLTLIKDANEKFDFSFPDASGKIVSLSDERFKNKAIVIQLMGTWCPNCLDETTFLSDWYNNKRNKNVELIALDYERITDNETVKNNIKRLTEKYNIHYPILFAGTSDKKLASQTLPMLNRVFAFPTTIFLNKEKKVVKIKTGFSGPATGADYEKFKRWFINYTIKL